jgi:ribulose-phosphate 3-epimerase
MSVVVPAVLVDTPEEYKAALGRVHTFAQRVHVDLSDGVFAPTQTIAASQIWWPQEWQVDIHAMVADPAQHVDELLALHPHLIIFHAEVKTDLIPVLQKVKMSGVKAGVALQRPTVPADVVGLIEAADHVMIFSGELGKYGGTASLMQLEKVRLIKSINASVEIGWDGGVNAENIFSLTQGGVDVMYVGGAIQKAADPEAAYATLVKEVNKQGVM